jgi:hypothetical protein
MFLRNPTAGLLRGSRSFAWLWLALALSPLPANAAEKSSEAWPTAVQARYALRYNGISVGSLVFNYSANAKTYTLSGSSKVSVLFGAFSWSGSTNVSGAVEGGAPAPTSFAFEWRLNKKNGSTQIGFKDHVATDIAIQPPPRPKPDVVPLMPVHKAKALDPMSAVMMLTRPDNRPPCDRRVGIFDGKHRYDIVLTPKKTTRLPASSGGGAAETGYVCRIMYEPIAGHRDNEDTKSYAANRDVEIVLRRVPGSEMLIPYSVSIPTSWGTGTMVTERIDIVTPAAGKIALTN